MMNLADPELDLVDPTPNVHNLFMQFDKIFFWTKLSNRAVVRWSKRMYSCAGICSYEGRAGLCDIALSEPLLKLRPRKDLIETLLHEMIHAYLFITCRDDNRDGHGPNFQSHMHRINKAAGLNISIYHSFHDEVELYQTHWWRCDGPCQSRRPHFGIVRRTCNRAPGRNDHWWESHNRNCGGTFIKFKEPPPKNTAKAKPKVNKGDITKYITTQKSNDNVHTVKPVLTDSNLNTIKGATKSNNAGTKVVTQKGTQGNKGAIFSPKNDKLPELFSGKGQTVSGNLRNTNSDIAETVRNIWANKQISGTNSSLKKDNKRKSMPTSSAGNVNSNKHKDVTSNSPPTKITKIDDYFKTTAAVLKDVYGQDFNLSMSSNNKVIATVVDNPNLVDCPVCNRKVTDSEINKHLDECLNNDIVNKLSRECIDNIYNESKVFAKNISDHDTANKNIKQLVAEMDQHKHIRNQKDVLNKAIVKMDIVKKETTRIDFDAVNNNRVLPVIVKEEKFEPMIKLEPSTSKIVKVERDELRPIKVEPGTSKGVTNVKVLNQDCYCCGNALNKSLDEHLDECLAFVDKGATTSPIETIVIDDDNDDRFDETITFNATGTKLPCPCCMKMIENTDMNNHLDACLNW